MRKCKCKAVRAAYAAATALLAAALLVGGSGGAASGQKPGEAAPAPTPTPAAPWHNADVALKQPSVIPHPIYPTPCVTCHKPARPAGAGVAGIPAIPHKIYPNCLQCHVPAGDEAVKPFRGNTFGQKRTAPGAKKPDAPPKPKQPAP